MTIRITAGAFLFRGSKVLLMKRGLHKKLGPGKWAGVGGHMEISDITDPRAFDIIETCYREIFEEAGICKSDIKNLKLRYIAARKVDNEIRLHHHFMGEVDTEFPLPICEEGELYWVAKKDIPGLPMSTTVGEAVKHWLANPENDGVYMVAVNKTDSGADISEL
ncbi:MAG: NUDIX domain-containing protein [Firmicutes bacterium]|nr:NUDIX domain-containing protein [Bacillota bacterium]